MKKLFIRRILPVFMVFVLALSSGLFVVNASAVAVDTVVAVLSLITSASGALKSLFDTTSAGVDFASKVRDFLSTNTDDTSNWVASSYSLNASGNRVETSVQVLDYLAQDWNQNYKSKSNCSLWRTTFTTNDGVNYYALRVTYDGQGGGRDTTATRYFLCDGNGRALVARVNPETVTDGVWIPIQQLSSPYLMMSYESLYNLATEKDGVLRQSGDRYFVFNSSGNRIFANPSGLAYSAFADTSKYASQQERLDAEIIESTTGESINTVTDNSTNIDLSNMTITIPTGDTINIDQLIYDESSKTYYIDCSESYTDNTTNQEYFNYTYQYHIQNTTVTYIGSSAEYTKKYEVYYQLPDGRSSADLTKEELEQLNVSMDVVPYSRSTDDVRLRALYHFDGDTRDSSYWNHLSSFEWHRGASITYMDAEAFNGALYLDANISSAFSIKLPSAIGTGDYTIQFRYYQSQATATDTVSGVYLNTTPMWGWRPDRDDNAYCLLGISGEELRPEGSSMASSGNYAVGSWNEFCITRKGTVLTFYVNGAALLTVTGSSVSEDCWNDYITFYFSDEQGAYRYIDELRVLNFAIASGGQSTYTPTAVPYDTNLSLVLPDDKIAVADEYWTFESSNTNLLEQYGLADWQHYGHDVSAYLYEQQPNFDITDDGLVVSDYHLADFPYVIYTSNAYSLSNSSSGVSFHREFGTDFFPFSSGPLVCDKFGVYWPVNGFAFRIGSGIDSSFVSYIGYGDFTFSIVLGDGSIYSYSFSLTEGIGISNTDGTLYLGGVHVYLSYAGSPSQGLFLYVSPTSFDVVDTVDFCYLELVKSSSTDLTATYHGGVGVLDDDKSDKPTLAVRTDIEITDYQIGGVRPAIPKKGLVYAMVESGYITSLQIYNGQAWEACDGRIWTGERWIPYSSFNVITLKDMLDIVDATQDYEYIYSESGFWSWWQKSWNAFTDKLFSVLGSGAGGGGSGSTDTQSFWSKIKDAFTSGLSNLIESTFSLIATILSSLIGAAADLLSGIFGFFSDTVLGGISDFFSSFSEHGGLFDGFQQTGEDGSTSTGLPDGVPAVFAFFAGLWLVLPSDLRYVLMFGVGLMVLLSVFKLVKE